MRLKNTVQVRSIIRKTKANQRLVTVVDKELIKEITRLYEYGPLLWPDPTKKDGLPYIRKDGQSNPEIEKLDRYP
jgi:hypothetical protein